MADGWEAERCDDVHTQAQRWQALMNMQSAKLVKTCAWTYTHKRLEHTLARVSAHTHKHTINQSAMKSEWQKQQSNNNHDNNNNSNNYDNHNNVQYINRSCWSYNVNSKRMQHQKRQYTRQQRRRH